MPNYTKSQTYDYLVWGANMLTVKISNRSLFLKRTVLYFVGKQAILIFSVIP